MKRKASEEVGQQKAPKRPRKAPGTAQSASTQPEQNGTRLEQDSGLEQPQQNGARPEQDSGLESQHDEQGDRRPDRGDVVAGVRTAEDRAAESLLCQIYAEVEAACDNESAEGRFDEEWYTFIHAARVGCMYDDHRAAPTSRTQDRFRDRLVEIEDEGYEHPAFAAVGPVVAEIRQPHRIALRRNLVEFADRFDWMLLAICAHSTRFRSFMMDNNVKASLRDTVDTLVDQNIGSLKLFACSRGLPWERLLSRHDRSFATIETLLSSPKNGVAIYTAEGLAYLRRQDTRRTNPERTLQPGPTPFDIVGKHPHELAIAADNSVSIPVLQLRNGSSDGSPDLTKKNINESRVLEREEYSVQRQHEWPIPDPRWRSRREPACQFCGNRPTDDTPEAWRSSICQCTVQDLKTHLRAQVPSLYTGDRIELVKAEPLGIGVRALQRFGSGSFLAEAVGEIYPPEDSPEHDEYLDAGMYTTEQVSVEKWKMYRRKNHRGVRRHDTNAVCQIDAAVFGNWPRYLNHSCNANTRIQQFSVGEKVLLCIRVEDGKDVGFGDVLTMNYGRQYFVGKKIACRCGEDCCQLWNAKRIGNNKKTLAEARADGTAPDWA